MEIHSSSLAFYPAPTAQKSGENKPHQELGEQNKDKLDNYLSNESVETTTNLLKIPDNAIANVQTVKALNSYINTWNASQPEPVKIDFYI